MDGDPLQPLLPNRPPALTVSQKAAYGVGHVLNDICAALWFSYTLLFMQLVLKIPATTSGALLLVGQVVDALATPLVGYMSDKWGSRKTWHLAGTVLVLVSFPLVFSECGVCWMAPGLDWVAPLYYAVLIAAFQTGWATVQIAHLSLIPDLTPRQAERAELTAIRYTASVCSSLALYVITWVVFHVTRGGMGMNRVGPGDVFKFRSIVFIGVTIGTVCSIWFRYGLNVPSHADISTRHQVNKANARNGRAPSQLVNGLDFLRQASLYQVALLYMASRLFLTLSLVYMPLYLDESLNQDAETLASVPFASFVASFVASLAFKYSSSCLSSKMGYLLGALISLAGCVWVGTGSGAGQSLQMYGVAVLLGAGSSITMVTSLCITADLIGPNTDSGAFVYGAVTFLDKLFNGVAVMIIEELKCEDVTLCPHYYQDVLAYACGGSALLGLIVLLTVFPYNRHLFSSKGSKIVVG
ncbi:Major facilitator superfamily domain-containing protein 12 [Frankliniella fusca]|uniref:Major facilitator superfamily domain-containing protein 12 n=1 Tax=Frankliniella fusca TaxID=407009 RepID=A0AAE1HQJ7_9NEOP|nr:Major facilitator superfamily domain-containing protein 12 [Frankliniella fusca]